MSEPHIHSHSHDHGPQAAVPPVAAVAAGPRASWLLHSAAQRLLGAALVCIALVAAMLWATSAQA
ncbi:hypothetical protein C6P61_12750 [Malikia spinosa]|uniref:Uncharacterized protein n=1 Tax=Malikia spinosa TaxID=86180 RepID=A0A2S9KCR3_9BURK|nr:hypothetical protein [Malikia spinosa]PRD68243.1 hypothetical protein C6P61_12750 [Malikia spinosa]